MPEIISINGVIGKDTTYSMVKEALDKANGKPIELQISSPGGSYPEMLPIYNAVKNYKGEKVARIIGFAASAASYIPMAADKVIAEDNAVFMIHNAQGIVAGDHKDLRETADTFENFSNAITKAYAKKTGKPLEEMQALMDKETFFFGKGIVEAGFADSMVESSTSDTEEEAIAYAKLSIADCTAQLKEIQSKVDLEKLAAYFEPSEIVAIVTPYQDSGELVDEAWSVSESESRWRTYAGVESSSDLPKAVYSKRFMWRDPENSDVFGGYKLPIWDYKDGEFVNISAVRNALARLSQTLGISADEKTRIETTLRKYLDKFNQQQQEKDEMTPEEIKALQEENAKLKAEAAAKVEPVEEQKAEESTIDLAAKILVSAEYPQSVKDVATKALKGKASAESLEMMVATADMIAQAQKSKDAAAETDALGDTPGKQEEDTGLENGVAKSAKGISALASQTKELINPKKEVK